MVYMFIWMVQDMKDIGKMICNMGMEKRYGQIIQNMKVNTMKEKSMAEDFMFGQMQVSMMVVGTKIE